MLENQRFKKDNQKPRFHPVAILFVSMNIVFTLGYVLLHTPAIQSALVDVMIVRIDIPPHLIVYNSENEPIFEYSSQTKKLVPVDGYKFEEDPNYDPVTSPDGNWTITYDPSTDRHVVSGKNKQFIFLYYCFSPTYMAWSPDSRFIAYRAYHPRSGWNGRIMVMSVETGQTWWVGMGGVPRWYSSKAEIPKKK